MDFNFNRIKRISKILEIIQQVDHTPKSFPITITSAFSPPECFGISFHCTISNHVDFQDLNKRISLFDMSNVFNIYAGHVSSFYAEGIARTDADIEHYTRKTENEAAEKILSLLMRFIAAGAVRNLKNCRDFIREQLEDVHSRLACKDYFTYLRMKGSQNVLLSGRKHELIDLICSQAFSTPPTIENLLESAQEHRVVFLPRTTELIVHGNLSLEEMNKLISDYNRDNRNKGLT